MKKILFLFSFISVLFLSITFANAYTESWTFESGSYDWPRSSDIKYEGSYSLKSEPIGHNKYTQIEFTIIVPSNAINPKVSYYVASDCERNYDVFYSHVNGAEKSAISGLITRGMAFC